MTKQEERDAFAKKNGPLLLAAVWEADLVKPDTVDIDAYIEEMDLEEMKSLLRERDLEMKRRQLIKDNYEKLYVIVCDYEFGTREEIIEEGIKNLPIQEVERLLETMKD